MLNTEITRVEISKNCKILADRLGVRCSTSLLGYGVLLFSHTSNVWKGLTYATAYFEGEFPESLTRWVQGRCKNGI